MTQDPEVSRDTDIARIAEALDTVPVGDYPWHHEAPHHPEYAAALYDAGLRPSAEPAGPAEHEHSEWECSVIVHVESRHWLDEPCSLLPDSPDRCP